MHLKRIIFMGTPEFALPTLANLTEQGYKPLLCITQPDKPQGRDRKLLPAPVKIKAQNLNIPTLCPEDVNSEDIMSILSSIDPELIITVAYGGYLKKKLRKLPEFGCINLHPSLLPRYRGASPINYTLFNDDSLTGNTVFRITAKMDAGPIIYQSKYRITEEDNFSSLSQKLARKGAEDIITVIHMLESGTVSLTPQDETQATYTRKLTSEDMVILWQNRALSLINQIRGLADAPGAKALYNKKILKIIKAGLTGIRSDEPAGTVVDIIKNAGFHVATADEDILIQEVQPAGKKIMSAYAFAIGARLESGYKLDDGI